MLLRDYKSFAACAEALLRDYKSFAASRAAATPRPSEGRGQGWGLSYVAWVSLLGWGRMHYSLSTGRTGNP